MTCRSTRVLALAAALLPALPAVVDGQAPRVPEVRFQARSVVLGGVTPGGGTVWFSVAREVAADDVATVVLRSDVRADDDGDGSVVWDLDRDVPLRSIWVGVDLATGAATVASPEGYPLRRVDWRGRGLDRGAGRADRIEDARGYAEILLVRPGQGAWRTTVGDGGDADDDGAADGKVAVSLDRLKPLGSSAAPPSRFDPADVVVLLDPNRMEVTLVRAGEVR